MKALLYDLNKLRYITTKLVSPLNKAVEVAPLSLVEIDPPKLPGDQWLRLYPIVSGICGSDLATIFSNSSPTLIDYVSWPFVLGHEIVALDDSGNRWSIQSILSCVPRGLEPCKYCQKGQIDKCQNLIFGDIKAGLQTGFCNSVSGGWAQELVAHKSQLVEIDQEIDDYTAVMIEPTACALHGVINSVSDGLSVAIIGAGTIGLCALACLTYFFSSKKIYVSAKWPHQQKLAKKLGAHWVGSFTNMASRIRLDTKSMKVGNFLTYGVDLTIDAIGSIESFNQAVSITAPGGKIILLGMPTSKHYDLTPLWLRQISLHPFYGYGSEPLQDKIYKTFELAQQVVLAKGLNDLVTKTYLLENYTSAINHAKNAGKYGAVKIAFLPNPRKQAKVRTS